MGEARGPRAGGMPLFLKYLTPFLVLMLAAGFLGAFLIIRDLSSRAETFLDAELSRHSLAARSVFQDRELYLLESASFAANVEGMAPAVQLRELVTVAGGLRSVLALKTDLTLLAVTDRQGRTLRGSFRAEPGELPTIGPLPAFGNLRFVERALNDRLGERHSGIARIRGRPTVAVAAPVCSGGRTCRAVGVAIAGIDLETLTEEAAARVRGGVNTRTGLAIFGAGGGVLASSGPVAADVPEEASTAPAVRSTVRLGDEDHAVLYTPFRAGARRLGALAVSIPTAPAFATAREAGTRLVVLLLLAVIGVIAVGALITRKILRQVRPLVETNRRLGSGDLTARAPVLSNDELGELAQGVNEMAEQLHASYETLEMRVAERTREVQRLLKERTEFFAAMSHEFRTPLALIMGEVDLLLDPGEGRDRETIADVGPRIKESAAQLLGVVNDILSLARAETGTLEVTPAEVDLGELLRDMRTTIEGLAHSAGLTTTLELGEDLTVRADPMRLREIILNLVDNAVKYTPPAGSITVEARSRGGLVEVAVTDTGVGIPEEAKERVFEPFFRVKGIETQRGQPSTGLGLALTKRLVEAHRGEITVRSRPGQGSTFTITLPVIGPRAQRRTGSSRRRGGSRTMRRVR